MLQTSRLITHKNYIKNDIFTSILPLICNKRLIYTSLSCLNNEVKKFNSDKDGINEYPNMGDDIDVNEWRKRPNIKVDKDGTMEIKDYMDPLLRKLPSFRTNIPMSLQGRMQYERERLAGMTDGERKWRAQWLKDQELKPNEPVNVPELNPFYNNIFRRAFHWPMDQMFNLFTPIIGATAAKYGRAIIPRIFFYYFVAILFTYYFCFNEERWETGNKIFVWKSRTPKYQGDDISLHGNEYKEYTQEQLKKWKDFKKSDS